MGHRLETAGNACFRQRPCPLDRLRKDSFNKYIETIASLRSQDDSIAETPQKATKRKRTLSEAETIVGQDRQKLNISTLDSIEQDASSATELVLAPDGGRNQSESRGRARNILQRC